MTRSPLFYPLNRGMDAEGGGAADLQTDVMRFMAILSLCLVAIFAMVQSIPLAPVVDAPATAEQSVELPQPRDEPSQPPETQPGSTPSRRITLVRPQAQRLPEQEKQPVLQRPVANSAPARPRPEPAATVIEPVAAARAPDTSQQGFTLRFASDVALTRLVARDEVGLYAIYPDKVFRMNVNRGEMSFWPASMPEQFHEMDVATVPEPVIDALQRSNGLRARDLRWGVTIPAGTARRLEQFLREASGGTLIIDATGELRLGR